jgi:hypothetical protein
MNIFRECNYKWELHYVQRLRSEGTGSALLFGSALDKAISHLLSKQAGSEIKVFEEAWKNASINNVMTDIENSLLIKYSKNDLDLEIIEETPELEHILYNRDNNGLDSLTPEELKVLNKANWDCLKIKGKLLIEAFKRDILPNIEEVLGLQVPIEIKNDTGDSIIGFADIICKYKGYDKPIIFDLKTAARKYPNESVRESVQLGLYTFALSNTYQETNLAGYMVLVKDIKKDRQKICVKCGNDKSNTKFKSCDAKVDKTKCGAEFKGDMTLYGQTQVIVDIVSDALQNSIINEAEAINQDIKTGDFPQNPDSCIGKFGKCVYYDYCKSGSTKGLVKLEEK